MTSMSSGAAVELSLVSTGTMSSQLATCKNTSSRFFWVVAYLAAFELSLAASCLWRPASMKSLSRKYSVSKSPMATVLGFCASSDAVQGLGQEAVVPVQSGSCSPRGPRGRRWPVRTWGEPPADCALVQAGPVHGFTRQHLTAVVRASWWWQGNAQCCRS